MTHPIIQDHLPHTPWDDPVLSRLPGTQPADPEDWVRVDEAFAAQMALRDYLVAENRKAVIGAMPDANDALQELLTLALDRARRLSGYAIGASKVMRPDGVTVPLERGDPLGVLGRLFQEDLCILQKANGEAEHLLTGAVLCFPAGWTLSEKLGKPLVRVHRPVPEYDINIARRVQRMLDGIRVGHPVWRANAHVHASPDLFTPRHESEPERSQPDGAFVRSERQVLFRLPQSQAIVFSIHTYVVHRDALTPAQSASLITSGRAVPI